MQENQFAPHCKLLQLYPLPYSGPNTFLFLFLSNWWDAAELPRKRREQKRDNISLTKEHYQNLTKKLSVLL